MRKLSMVPVLFWIMSVTGNAQNITIKGSIVDQETKTAIEQATVQLFSLPDTTYVKGAASLNNGEFNFSGIKPGNYWLKISFIGYKNVEEKLEIKRSPAVVDLGRIDMRLDAILLEGAVIVAEAPPVTMIEDTVVYNAAAYRVAEGAMLEELVKKLPGAEVDDDGKITINGKEVKKIMVDGKEFFSDDPKVSMKNLPVNMVENVKAYDRQSDMSRLTGIDDGEEETVLDLTVKKGMKQGWIGNIIAGYGNHDRYEAGGIMNRFQDDLNFSVLGSINNTNNKGFSDFGDAGLGLSGGSGGSGVTAAKSVGVNFAKNTNKLKMGGNVQYGYTDNDAVRTSSTERFLNDQSSFGNSVNESRRQRDDFRAELRFEWKMDSLTTIIFRPNASYSATNSVTGAFSETQNNNRQTVNKAETGSLNSSNNYSIGGRFEIYRRMKKAGRNFSLGVNFGVSDTDSDIESTSETVFHTYDDYGDWLGDSISDIYRTTNSTSRSRNYSINASYTEPVFPKHFLQFRYTFTHRYSLAESLVYDQDSIVAGVNPDGFAEDLSNRVENFYDTHSASMSLRGVYSKMMYSAGVAVNPQSSRSETTIGPNTSRPNLKQTVVNYTPNMMFRYRFTPQSTLMFRYSGRTSAPNVTDLQEVIDQTDPLNLRYGNPNLKPSFNNSFNLSFNRFVPESMRSYAVNLSFSNTLNSVANKLIYNQETGGNEYYRVNVNGNWNTRGYFSFNTPFKNKKFTLSSNTNSSFANSVSYTSLSSEEDAVLSTTHTFSATEKLTGNYRTDKFDVSLNASVTYGLTRNSERSNVNRETFDYLFGGSTNINLPWRLYLSSDINFRIKEGYSSSFSNDEIIWNAQLSKNLLKHNRATVRVKMYDILHKQSNLTRTISETMMSDTEYNTIGSYFMVHFVYRLNTLGGRAPRSGMGPRGGEYGGPREGRESSFRNGPPPR